MGGQSPYRHSVASRNDGRPPTRPITPIKSAQQARYPQHTASNTSQITNSIIGQQDESQISQQPPNLGLMGQASAPMGNAPNMRVEGDDEAEQERNVPSELRSRPKIPRTPAEGDRPGRGDQDVPAQLAADAVIKVKGQVVEDGEQIKEHEQGFAVREKIQRTPPEERAARNRQRAAQQKATVDLSQYYNEDGLSKSPSKKMLSHNVSDPDLQIVAQLPQVDKLPIHQRYQYAQQQNRLSMAGQGLTNAIQASSIYSGSPSQPQGRKI